MTEKKTSTTSKPRKTAATKPAARKPAAKKPAATATTAKKSAAKTATKKASGETVTIDGKSYSVDALSQEAKAQINNVRAADRLIGELETELAITKTARQRYGEALGHELKSLNTTIQ